MLEMNFIDTRSSTFLNVENILLIDSNTCFRYVLVERGYLKVRKMILFLLVQQRRDDLAGQRMEIKKFSINRNFLLVYPYCPCFFQPSRVLKISGDMFKKNALMQNVL